MNICIVVQHGATFPIGLFYIAASIKNAGHDICWLEFPHNQPDENNVSEAVKNLASTKKIDALLCGALFIGWKEFKSICDGAKKADKNLLVIGGGGLFEHSSEIAMELCDNCDIAVLSEGEITIVNLLEALQSDAKLSTVKGIVYRDNDGGLVYTSPGDIPHNLDDLPLPLYSPSFIEKIKQRKYTNIVAGRSCPFSCTFCSLTTRKKYRQRSVDNVFNEVKWLVDNFDVKYISFVDELFAINGARVNEYIQRLAQFDIAFSFSCRPDSIDPSLLCDLRKVGMDRVFVGIENINDEILVSINKKTTAQQAIDFLEQTKKHGIANRVEFSIIMGDPAETVTTAANSLRWFMENAKDFPAAAFGFMTLYPGSKLYRDALQSGLVNEKDFFNNYGTYSSAIALSGINITNFSAGAFSVLQYLASFVQMRYAHNPHASIEISVEKGHAVVTMKESCNNSEWKFTIDESNKLLLDAELGVPSKCNSCVCLVQPVIRDKLHHEIGIRLQIFLENNKKCAIWGVSHELVAYSEYIKDAEFVLIDPHLPFSAEDWEVFEDALGCEKNMTQLLSNHPACASLPCDDSVDTVIVLLSHAFDQIKEELHTLNPQINVVAHTDLLILIGDDDIPKPVTDSSKTKENFSLKKSLNRLMVKIIGQEQ